jgi:threonine dehydratase
VVTSSTGNHGAATAYAARRLDVPAAIFLPEGPNPVKRALIAREGAHIVEAGKFLEESRQHAAQHAREKGWHLVVDGEDEHLTAGASTIGCEIVEQAPSVDIILVPVGDSSLIRGTAFAAKHGKSKVQVVGVVADRAPAYYRSWKERRAVSTESSDTIADGLAVRATVEANVRQLLELVDDMRMVTDDEMLRAMYHLLVEEHVVAEPAGAAATAALVKSGRQFAGKKVVLLVTGANVPPELLRRALNLASS